MIAKLIVDLWIRPLIQGFVGTTAALLGLGIAGAVGSTASGIIGSNAAGKAADAGVAAADRAAALQKQAADDALNFNKLQYGNALNLGAPYYNTGTASLNRLSYLMGLSPNQGLPPGVVNPNSPAPVNTPGPVIGRTVGDMGGDILPPINRGGGTMVANRFNSMVPMAGGTDPSQSPANPAPGATNSINPGDFGPPQLALDPNDPTQATAFPGNPDAHNFGTGGLQVPRIDGGGQPGQAAPGGDFGSLAQGFNEQFTAPTDVTEQNDPGYQFRLQQGSDALERSAAARGGLLSGGTAKSLSDYNQNAASGEYGNVYNRAASEFERRYNMFKQNQQDQFNRFATLAGIGQTQAGQLNSAGLNFGNNAGNILQTAAGQIGQNINNAGAARGSGYVGGANAITGAISGGLNNLSLLALMQKQNAAGAGGLGV